MRTRKDGVTLRRSWVSSWNLLFGSTWRPLARMSGNLTRIRFSTNRLAVSRFPSRYRAPMTASIALARMLARDLGSSFFNSPRDICSHRSRSIDAATSDNDLALTKLARQFVRSPSSLGYWRYRNSLTTSSKTASPRNSSRSLWPRSNSSFSFRYEQCTRACRSRSGFVKR